MALLEKQTSSLLLGVGVGAGALLVLRYVAPVVAAVARPFTKGLIAASLEGFEKATHQLAVAAEAFQDLVAEARADRASATSATSAASAASSVASASREVN